MRRTCLNFPSVSVSETQLVCTSCSVPSADSLRSPGTGVARGGKRGGSSSLAAWQGRVRYVRPPPTAISTPEESKQAGERRKGVTRYRLTNEKFLDAGSHNARRHKVTSYLRRAAAARRGRSHP
jgi:hypothetical protein